MLQAGWRMPHNKDHLGQDHCAEIPISDLISGDMTVVLYLKIWPKEKRWQSINSPFSQQSDSPVLSVPPGLHRAAAPVAVRAGGTVSWPGLFRCGWAESFYCRTPLSCLPTASLQSQQNSTHQLLTGPATLQQQTLIYWAKYGRFAT